MIVRLLILSMTLCLLSPESVWSQRTQASAKKPAPIKPPKLFTSLGVATDSMVFPVEQVNGLIANPLTVRDAAGKTLQVTYYQFLYRRRAVTEDPATGKILPTTSLASDDFTTTPLPPTWIKLIRQDLVKGEELFFFDIIVKDAAGQRFYAPNLKIFTR